MRRISVLVGLFILCMALSTSNLYAAGCSPTRGKSEVSQGAGSPCTSIQSAIDAAGGVNPVVISVLPGTYTESITMKNNINLQGAGADVTIVQAQLSEAFTLTNVSNVTISGFTIQSNTTNGTGIWNIGASPTIKDNVIKGNRWGIYNEASASPKILNNQFIGNSGYSSGCSVGNYQASAVSIIGNRFISTGGVDDQYSTSTVITDNLFTDITSKAIYTMNSTSLVIKNNTIVGATNHAIDFRNGSATIVGNIIKGCSGYALFEGYSTSVIKDNTIMDSQTGLLAYNNGVTPSYYSNNKLMGNQQDLEIMSSCTMCYFNFNSIDTINNPSLLKGSYNVKSDGTPW